MTPTERAAVAEAIAALEPFAKASDLFTEELGYGDRAIIMKGVNIRNLRQSVIALASLRALAPAPADQSDAGRDGVIEQIAAMVRGVVYADHYRAWPTLEVENRTNTDHVTRQCDALADAILKLRVGVIVAMTCPKCGNRRYREWCPYCDTESVIDQAEAGRDGVVAEARRSAFAQCAEVAEQLARDANDYDEKGCAACAMSMAKAYRALASAPSEAKFRCNCPHEVRGGCLEPGCPHGNVLSEAPKPPGQEPGGDPAERWEIKNVTIVTNEKSVIKIPLADMNSGECFAGNYITSEHRLPTADREAIQEALNASTNYVRRIADETDDAEAEQVIIKNTAALALIGEG